MWRRKATRPRRDFPRRSMNFPAGPAVLAVIGTRPIIRAVLGGLEKLSAVAGSGGYTNGWPRRKRGDLGARTEVRVTRRQALGVLWSLTVVAAVGVARAGAGAVRTNGIELNRGVAAAAGTETGISGGRLVMQPDGRFAFMAPFDGEGLPPVQGATIQPSENN